MATNKHFLQDRTVLLLVSFESFLTLLISTLIVLQLNAMGSKATFLNQFRSLPNATDFVSGGSGVYTDMWGVVSFIAAAFGIYAISLILAYRVYKLRRELSLVVLVLTLILLMFVLAVSNILLVIR